MIQVVHRACDILEALAGQPEAPQPLGAIADGLGLNHATCANILKTLVNRGYVEQVAPKQGYLLGPMAYFLAGRGAYRRGLVAAAEPVVGALARELGEPVLLVMVRGGRRYILCHAEGSEGVEVSRRVLFDENVWRTPTGRLLMAWCDDEERARFIREHGLPGEDWREARSEQDLNRLLEGIRKADRLVLEVAGDVRAVAYAVRDNGRVIAAVGTYLPSFRFRGAHRRAVLQGVERASRAISDAITTGPRDA
ncbi:MAG: helix-turn-helix domain-containing protein [Candidatus Hydrogenedentes bacterium]|nr:helix-turn-helix domain-containing protein [Candidatus Hydrogenedentota bacterium]